MISEKLELPAKFRIVSGNYAAVAASAQSLERVKAKAADDPERTNVLALVFGAHCLRAAAQGQDGGGRRGSTRAVFSLREP